MQTAIELPVIESLKQRGISRIAKQRSTVLVQFQDRPVRFDIDIDKWSKTIQNFEKASKGLLDQETKQAIIFYLSNQWINLIENSYGIVSSDPSGETRSRDDGDSNKSTEELAIDPVKDLDPYIQDRNYAEFVVRTAKKTVKQEDLLVRLLVYVGLTVYSHNPLCIGIRAPTSEGKTYAVIQSILKFFPKEDLLLIGSISPKALIRQHGVLVDSNNQPLEPKIKELRKQIKSCEENDGNSDQKKVEELEEKIRQLNQEAKYLIDLHGKIILFLEPPHPEVWNIIKSILSHDNWEISHPYVDTDLKTKNVVTRGWPSCIFCSAKDESRWDIWPEIQSRFLISSPNMTPEKYRESNMLTFQKLGLPDFVQQRIIVSDFEVELARKCVLYLKQQIKSLCPIRYVANEFKPLNPAWIPYQQYLGESLPSNKGPSMRTANHVGSLLNVVTLANSQFRLDCGGIEQQKMVIARPEDLVEVLRIAKDMTSSNYSGIPQHKVRFLKEIFIPSCKSKTEPDSNGDGKQEKIIAVTTKELCDFYKNTRGKGITTDNLKKQYLNELLANDIIGEIESEIDKRQHIYYLLVDLQEEDQDYCLRRQEKITKLSNGDIFDNFLHIPRLKLSNNYKEIPENWLILQILTLTKYRIDLDNFKGCLADFLNQSEELKFFDSNRLTIRQFISKYESNSAISIRYIFVGHFYNFHSKIFGKMIGICLFDNSQSKKLSNSSSFDNLVIFSDDRLGHTMSVAAITNNINYSQAISLKTAMFEKKNMQETAIVEEAQPIKIKPVEEFFYDNPDLQYQPLPPHSLEQSPCCPIISKIGEFYRCKLHPKVSSIHLDPIEQHCKYNDRELHKAKILHLTSESTIIRPKEVTTTNTISPTDEKPLTMPDEDEAAIIAAATTAAPDQTLVVCKWHGKPILNKCLKCGQMGTMVRFMVTNKKHTLYRHKILNSKDIKKDSSQQKYRFCYFGALIGSLSDVLNLA